MTTYEIIPKLSNVRQKYLLSFRTCVSRMYESIEIEKPRWGRFGRGK
jgi:hypothetical protein